MCTYMIRQKGVQQSSEEHFNPLNIGRIMVSEKGAKIYGIVIESKIDRGVLGKLSELAEGSGVCVRYIQFSMEQVDKPAVTAIAFLDFSDAKVSPEQILKLVRSQDFVVDAQLIKPDRNGILYDKYFFPLVVAKNQRVVIFWDSIYGALFKGIMEKFGSAGAAMLYYQGFTVGSEVYDDLMKTVRSKNLEDFIEVAKASSMTFGWGMIKDLKIDVKKETAQLQIYRNFECELGIGTGKPYSQFFRGVIAGVFSRIFKKEVKVNETKCMAKGDPYCEFIIKR